MKVFIFPGQGSQSVGMGKALAENFQEAREVFQEVDEALAFNLSKLMFDGPIETLTMTEHTQPALMAVSMAVIRIMQKQGGLTLDQVCRYVAGHSLGEYTALAAADAFSLSDCAKILQIRGRAMQAAVPGGIGGMVALIGVTPEDAAALARDAAGGQVCQLANDNGGGQIVISGHMEAMDRAIELAGQRGIKRAIKLPVSAPFHSALMEPAAKAMEEALAAVKLRSPIVPVVANVTVEPVTDPDTIRALLVKQVCGQVRWRETVEFFKKQDIQECYEIGSGKVLSGLVKRIEKELPCTSIESPQEIEALLLKV
ncbi:MAG: ACP S-malonyltransferase [Alphaproteobacteria bacterium]|nr:ACP S-malonyltransferase [Alphaproteobacteria bacterium]